MKSLCVFSLVALLVAAPLAHAQGPLNGGDANCDGTNSVSDLSVMIAYLFRGGAAPCALAPMSTPIAWGVVWSGTIYSSSGNFTCTYNWTYGRYEISITGYSYHFQEYITLVTPVGGTYARMALSTSVGGVLLVYLKDENGNSVQDAFQFVVYKPNSEASASAVRVTSAGLPTGIDTDDRAE